MFICLDTVPALAGQTDGHTHGIAKQYRDFDALHSRWQMISSMKFIGCSL